MERQNVHFPTKGATYTQNEDITDWSHTMTE